MADVKSVRTEYIVGFTHDEMSLLFRAVGRAAGAKVTIRAQEIEALRTLNLKLAKTRAGIAAQLKEVADGAVQKAEELMGEPIGEEVGNGE